MDTILPSSELRNRYSEISKMCRETREPIYLTVNGHGDTVIMNIVAFNRMKAELELLKELALAEADIKDGRVIPYEEAMESIRKKFNFK